MISSRHCDPASPIRYVDYTSDTIATTAAITNARGLGVWMFPARYPFAGLAPTAASSAQQFRPWSKVVDVIVNQSFAGVGGTSQQFNVFKNGTSIFSTLPTVSLAAGAVAFDTTGFLALPTGCTRAVFATTAGLLQLQKGDQLTWTCPTVTGTYTTAPNIQLIVIVDSVGQGSLAG